MNIFFKNNCEQKEYIAVKLAKIYPKFKKAGMYYADYLKQNVSATKIILDAGCGDGGAILYFKPFVKHIIGVDINKHILNKNIIVDQKLLANLENIPLKKESIDIITCDFVLEHLENPQKVFNEFNRVLKNNGLLIFITSNVLNPIMLLSKITPYSVHKIFLKWLLKKEVGGHKTFYRANTYKKLTNLAYINSFKINKLRRVGNPEYMAFCKPLVVPAIFLEKFIDNCFLDLFKMYLVGYFIKNNENFN